MYGDEVQDWAAERTRELPGALLEHPFGPETHVYRVRGKMFMIVSDVTGVPLTSLKATPADVVALQEAFPEITPGYHLNKRHWISLRSGGTLGRQLVEDLVTESYLLVIEKNLPRSEWPVDPATFGQRPE
ncbi:MmcQ/YjbR family DNA-binding protein [Leucobacter sp. CSA2]|uniref:MmcQ/YjbR family DNA-binding protein n=1 Tax=Leucobacter edaphi TaxID=2796472 RepID=A0A934UX42_9MICO|nr:MmcQ/YjbR family DNA-binding protein [Leucobacter edaphi]MBK0422344.1 MmcQ/YjbR family DNA-binding protein [Leucobacter edaphi]